MFTAIAIYLGLGAAFTIWAFTGQYDNGELNELRARVVARWGALPLVVFVILLWPLVLGTAVVAAWLEGRRA